MDVVLKGLKISRSAVNAFAAKAVPRKTYDPPQLKAPLNALTCCFDWYTHRSQACPGCSRVVVGQIDRCHGGNVFVKKISDPEDFFRRLLEAKSPDCPKDFQGIWWFRDNQAQETLVTLQDAVWTPSSKGGAAVVGVKQGNLNWTHDPTCIGAGLAHPLVRRIVAPTAFAVSDDGKWIFIQENFFRAWAYVVQPGDDFVQNDNVPIAPGDWIRLNFEDLDDPTSKVTYQYHLTRVAFYDDDGTTLVYTPAYAALKKLALHPDRYPMPYGCVGRRTRDQVYAQWALLSDDQLVRYAPPPSSSSGSTSSATTQDTADPVCEQPK